MVLRTPIARQYWQVSELEQHIQVTIEPARRVRQAALWDSAPVPEGSRLKPTTPDACTRFVPRPYARYVTSERTIARRFNVPLNFALPASSPGRGVPVPGNESEPLARLAAALADTGAKRLVVLGDFWHARAGRTGRLTAALAEWRAARPAVRIDLIRGNHESRQTNRVAT